MPRSATCLWCETPFRKNSAPQRYCSEKCRGLYYRSFPENKEAQRLRHQRWSEKNYDYKRAYALAYTQGRIRDCPWISLVEATRKRAAKKGIPHNLTYAWAEARWTGACEVTGLPFSTNRIGHQLRMFRPSIDRIRPKTGYLQENCRFVLWAVNTLKSDGDDMTMFVIADAIARRGADFVLG